MWVIYPIEITLLLTAFIDILKIYKSEPPFERYKDKTRQDVPGCFLGYGRPSNAKMVHHKGCSYVLMGWDQRTQHC